MTVAEGETDWPENDRMTFSRSNRREREERRERSNYVSGGPGFRFCQKHRQRYRDVSLCPTCFPPATARTR